MTYSVQTRSLTQKVTHTDASVKPSNPTQTPKYTYELRSSPPTLRVSGDGSEPPNLRFSGTSSLSTPKEHEVHLDFDESSRAWRSNKRSIGNGCYTYLLDNEPIANTERPKRMRRSPVRYQV